MSVLKSLDIDFPQSEKKSLYRFLSLYVFFTLIILALTVSLYYNLQKELANSQRTIELNEFSNEFLTVLKDLYAQKKDILHYKKDAKFKISLYGEDYDLIYSNLKDPVKSLTQISYTNNKVIKYITNHKDHYKHTQYVVTEIIDDKKWLDETLETLTIYSVIFFIVMVFVGYFLLKLFLKPMKDAIHLLDTFINDTTHELNTPVSTIMTNIELIDKENIDDKYLLKIINRIEIGTKTISNIYDDLSFLILNNKIISNNDDINLKQLIEQRVEYFYILANIKKVNFITRLNPDIILNIDNKKISKLIDNILSNAIKYNKVGGKIYIDLYANKLTIKDTGVGIKQEHIDSMFDRFTRFDNVVGGFGIGLNIVKLICQEYDLDIKITSELDKWTEISITW